MNSLTQNPGYVYLLHFEEPISPSHPCRHYLGWVARDLNRRIEIHRRGRRRINKNGKSNGCARLCEVAKQRNISFIVARIWQGGPDLERRLKNQHNSPKLCPICNPAAVPQLTAPDMPF